MSAKKSGNSGNSNNSRQSNKSTSQSSKSGSSGSSGNKNSAANSKNSKNSKSSKNNSSSKSTPKHSADERQPILSGDIRYEVFGVLLVVLAIALFIAVVSPGNAVVSKAISTAIWMLFGVGALIMPFMLAAWGVSFFLRTQLATSRKRLIVGVSVVFIAALTLISINTNGAPDNPSRLFIAGNLTSHGGYLGAVFGWLLLRLLGYAISVVIAIGAIIIGATLIGFSLVSLAGRLNRLFMRNRNHDDDYDNDESNAQTSAYDMGDAQPRARANQPARNVMLTPTARLASANQSAQATAPDSDFQDFLDDDFFTDDNSQADALDYAEKTYLPDPTFGETRRIKGREHILAEAEMIRDDLDDFDLEDASPRGTILQLPSLTDNTVDPEAATVIMVKDKVQVTQNPPQVVALNEQYYDLPNMQLLKVSRSRQASRSAEAELRAVASELQETLQEFQVDAQVVGWTAGPTVTLYKLALGEGVRVARITSLADDIALALAASSVRIFSPIPGTSLVGVEVPNAERSMVLLGDVLPSAPSGSLQVGIGKDVEGSNICANLSSMPHLLIGGTTGSGKSVAINSMIMSMLMRTTPAEVRMILIDPKMVELTKYNDIPHLYVPVVTDASKAAAALAWAVIEMERRLKVFMEAGVKNIADFNEQAKKDRESAIKKAEKDHAKAMAAYEKQLVQWQDEENDAVTEPEQQSIPTGDQSSYQSSKLSSEQSNILIFASQSDANATNTTQADAGDSQEWDDWFEDELEWDEWRGDDYQWDEPASAAAADTLTTPEAQTPAETQAQAPTSAPTQQAPTSAPTQQAPLTAQPTTPPTEPQLELPPDLPEELPLVVIVIDELADLMIVAGKDVESSVTRLSQLARAAGLHLIIATQRPSTNVITGVIKANIVNRIAFNVGSGIDSRVILDSTGAETLLGNGDMLFAKPEYGKPIRIQGCYVSEAEINDVTNHWRGQAEPQYREEILATAVAGLSTYQAGGLYDSIDSDDPLVWDAADIVVTTQMGSTSTLQRRLKVGYARAGRIMDNLERHGIVGPANGSKPREVFVDDVLELESIRALVSYDK
ncbi:MAG: DNA translocase FtsK 4TM domain-containing protein [Coriobacteriia bacterium]|nr:DNA translocase FtsK 4TM domain-containing protein [Coriobacteriia bacterium]